MASPRRVLSRLTSRFFIAGVAAVSVLSLAPAAAHADPKVTAAQAQAQLASLSDKAEALTEQYNAAQARLDAARHALATDEAAITKAQQQVDATRSLVAGLAGGVYESGGFSTAQAMLGAGDPQAAMQRAAALAVLSEQRSAQLRTAKAAHNKLAQAKATAAQRMKTIQAMQTSLQAQRKTIDSLVVQPQARLKAAQTHIAANKAAAAAAAARVAAAAAARARANRSISRTSVPQVAAIPGSGGAAAAVRYAYAQLGKPYRWAAAGPYSFDCSGLTMRAWEVGGVSLPHNAAMQYAETRHVSRSQLQPGDLVYFGNPIHHVGIYIGGGNMIEAPYTGADVRITNFGYRTDYAGASRP